MLARIFFRAAENFRSLSPLVALFTYTRVANSDLISTVEAYRLGLLGKGTLVKRDGSGGVVSVEAYALAQRQEGKLTVAERLRLRMKWLTHGAVIGSRQFVEEHLNASRLMNARREQIPPRRFARDTATTWPESLFALRGGRA